MFTIQNNCPHHTSGTHSTISPYIRVKCPMHPRNHVRNLEASHAISECLCKLYANCISATQKINIVCFFANIFPTKEGKWGNPSMCLVKTNHVPPVDRKKNPGVAANLRHSSRTSSISSFTSSSVIANISSSVTCIM
jgi:hypothetical protein